MPMGMSVRLISFQNTGILLGAVDRHLMHLSSQDPNQPVLTKEVPGALSCSTSTLLWCSFSFSDCSAIERQVCSLWDIGIPTSVVEMEGYSDLGSEGHILMPSLRHLKSGQQWGFFEDLDPNIDKWKISTGHFSSLEKTMHSDPLDTWCKIL